MDRNGTAYNRASNRPIQLPFSMFRKVSKQIEKLIFNFLTTGLELAAMEEGGQAKTGPSPPW